MSADVYGLENWYDVNITLSLAYYLHLNHILCSHPINTPHYYYVSALFHITSQIEFCYFASLNVDFLLISQIIYTVKPVS